MYYRIEQHGDVARCGACGVEDFRVCGMDGFHVWLQRGARVGVHCIALGKGLATLALRTMQAKLTNRDF